MARSSIEKKPNRLGLTDKQVRFCRAYAKTLKGGQSYVEAGYEVSSMSSADTCASTLLRNEKIQEYLKDLLDLDEVSIVNAVTAVALTPITEVIKWDGKELYVKHTDHWSDRARLAVKKVKAKPIIDKDSGMTIATEIEVEMHDRLAALEKLMKQFKIYPKDTVSSKEKGDGSSAETETSEETETTAAAAFFRDITGVDLTALPDTMVARSE